MSSASTLPRMRQASRQAWLRSRCLRRDHPRRDLGRASQRKRQRSRRLRKSRAARRSWSRRRLSPTSGPRLPNGPHVSVREGSSQAVQPAILVQLTPRSCSSATTPVVSRHAGPPVPRRPCRRQWVAGGGPLLHRRDGEQSEGLPLHRTRTACPPWSCPCADRHRGRCGCRRRDMSPPGPAMKAVQRHGELPLRLSHAYLRQLVDENMPGAWKSVTSTTRPSLVRSTAIAKVGGHLRVHPARSEFNEVRQATGTAHRGRDTSSLPGGRGRSFRRRTRRQSPRSGRRMSRRR